MTGQTAQASLFSDTQPSLRGPWQLPSGWEWIPLESAFSIRSGTLNPASTPEETFSLYSMPAYDAGGEPEIRKGREIGSAKTIVEPGDILLSKLNPRIPRVWRVTDKFSLRKIASTDFLPLVGRSTSDGKLYFDTKFSVLFLLSDMFRAQVKHIVQGATGSRQRLKREDVLTALLPRPHSLDTQRRIVARIEALMADLKEARTLASAIRDDTDRFIEAALSEVFSKLPSNRCPLIEVLEGKPRNGWSPQCDNDPAGTPVLKLGAVLGFRFDPSAIKYTSLPTDPKAHYWSTEGDIFISRSNTPELVGHAAIYSGKPSPCIYPDLLMKMRTKPATANPKFVVYWLRGREARTYIRTHATGASSTMKKITQGDVCSLPFPKIPLEEQRHVVAYLNAIQAEVDEMRRLQAWDTVLINQVEQSILEKAFRGEL